MHRHALASASLVVFAFATPAMANDDVMQQSAKPEQWVLQTGNYTNQRYSKLDQINRDNVKNLKVAWTFSTGVLRGHEGSPLVRSEEHTSELQSHVNLVCRLLLE